MRRKRKKKSRIILIIVSIIMLIGAFFVVKLVINNNKTNSGSGEIIRDNDKQEEVNVTLDKAPNNYIEFSNLSDGEYLTDNGNKLVIKDGVSYIDDLVIVNKTYKLPSDYKPVSPYQEVVGERCNNCINKEAMEAFLLMQSDAKSVGLNIYISSGYRSYTYQEKLYNNYVAANGKDEADTYSARPGYSEHQTGTCFDLNTIDDSFQYTDEGKWVNNNAHLYGFIIRYPKGKEKETGYQYESWHLRYVGKELALKLYNDGDWKTLEEYYGITSSYE